MKIKLVLLLAMAGLLSTRPSFGVTELIANGDFSATPPSMDWSISLLGATSHGISFTPHGFLSMGNIDGPATQVVEQQVTIPSDTILAQFTYELNDTSEDNDNDASLSSLILDATGTLVLTNLDTKSNGDQEAIHRSLNLDDFIGQTVDVAFEVNLDDEVTNTTFKVSRVSLLAYTAADIPPNDFFSNRTELDNLSNLTVFATNVLATAEPGEPLIDGGNGGHSLWWTWTAPSNGVATINTSGSTFIALLDVYTGESIGNLTSVAADSGGLAQVQFLAVRGKKYQIAVDGKNGATGVIQLNVSFLADAVAPTVTIKTPTSNAKLMNSTVTLTGSASDNVAISFVQVQLVNADGSNEVLIANGTNTWSATVTNLAPGPNTLLVQAFDTNTNGSPVAIRNVNLIVTSALTVTTSGTGTVTPDLTKKSLDVGQIYTLTARPGAGEAFLNWTGDASATTAALTFTMQSNMVLQANFVPNPFPPVMGNYQGLFYDFGNPQHTNAGFFNATLLSSGAFSSKIILAGKSYSLSGQFSAGGVASGSIARKGLSTVTAQLQLDLSGGGIMGTFSDGTFTSQLQALRPMTNAAALAGKYTLFLPSGGNSYGTVTVTATGGLTLVGELADDTKAAQKTSLLANGTWPLYVPLYSGAGSVFGWITFSNEADTDLSGNVVWTKPAQATAKFYPAGFTVNGTLWGSLYTNASPVLNFSDGLVQFSGGDLTSLIVDSITLGADNRVTNNSPNSLTLTITPTTGAIKGTFRNPTTSKSDAFRGVVLQKLNGGVGIFLGAGVSGTVVLSPPPE